MDDTCSDMDLIAKYSKNIDIIRTVQGYFKRLSVDSASNLITLILTKVPEIPLELFVSENSSFRQHNMGKILDGKLKIENVKYLEHLIISALTHMNMEIPEYDAEKNADIKTSDWEGTFVVNKNTTYEKYMSYVYKESGRVIFKYDFNNPDLEVVIPKDSCFPQRCKIQILEEGERYGHPIKNVYLCTECKQDTERCPEDADSTNDKISCPHLVGKEEKQRRCKTSLSPHKIKSSTTTAYYFQIGCKDENGKVVVSKGRSFFDIDPMDYEAVMFKISNAYDKDLFHIIDVKHVVNNTFKLPDLSAENYLFTLQKKCDEYIEDTTGMKIYGLTPIKIALIIQTIMHRLDMELKGNIMLVGDKSSGKSLVLDYYSCLLNYSKHKITDGGSVSLPALRGTAKVVFIHNKSIHTVTKGYLGQYNSITIDESGENPELVKQLKIFLMKNNYGYSKAGDTGISHIRTAHVNLSENINEEHMGLYIGSIKRAYEKLSIKIDEKEIPTWDDSWDLYSPLHFYNENLYLRKVIEDKRVALLKKKIYWIDGHGDALHERFPFYFFIVNEKIDNALKIIVAQNSARKQVRDENMLKSLLQSDSLEAFFDSLKEYNTDDNPNDLLEAEKIFEEYNMKLTSRIREFWYRLLRVSRIVNKRTEMIADDYNLLRWFIEKTNCKMDVTETLDYKIIGPPDKVKEKEVKKKIAEARKIDNRYGIHDDEESELPTWRRMK